MNSLLELPLSQYCIDIITGLARTSELRTFENPNGAALFQILDSTHLALTKSAAGHQIGYKEGQDFTPVDIQSAFKSALEISFRDPSPLHAVTISGAHHDLSKSIAIQACSYELTDLWPTPADIINTASQLWLQLTKPHIGDLVVRFKNGPQRQFPFMR